MKHNFRLSFLFLLLFCGLFLADKTSYAYGEISIATEVSSSETTVTEADYNNWLPLWQSTGASDTGKVVLTPGSTESDLNFSWYAQTAAAPAVMLSDSTSFDTYKVFRGTITKINRTNGTFTYKAACHVDVTNYFKENTTYYYRTTNDISAATVEWSDSFTYKTPESGTFSTILVGDAQIGASDNIASDTYNWNRTLRQAVNMFPTAAFLISLGDQINYKTDSGDNGLRESQYAGFLYPSVLRSLPVAAVIGNHETKGSDYKYHFNNPNSSKNYGATPSGCDYYFSYGNALFVVLNSNSRNVREHRKLLNKATTSNPDAKWRIVLFHHDIYGSGVFHSNRTSTNLRALLAPLMDEFQIDLVFSGHDHSYARSYPMLNGTALTYDSFLTNPMGTTYISLGTSTGSKMYGLAYPRQFYVAERSNNTLATYSALTISDNSLVLTTYDVNGNKYADDLTIKKTKTKKNPLNAIYSAKARKKTAYTKQSFAKLKAALKQFQTSFKLIETDTGAADIENYYGTKKDPLSYYGYAAGTASALPDGFSTLIDKTRISCVSLSPSVFSSVRNAVKHANKNLVKTSLVVKNGTDTLKKGATLSLKEGTTLKLNITGKPSKYKITCSSASKQYVTITNTGLICAKKERKKAVTVTIKFQNRIFKLKIKVYK